MADDVDQGYKFERVYRLVIGESGSSDALEIAPPFHMEFSVNKTGKKEPNTSTVRIYNLSNDTFEKISKPDQMLYLYVGYVQDGGATLLSCGSVTSVEREKQGADWITEVEFRDGFKVIRDSVVSRSYQSGTSVKKILRDLADEMKLTLDLSEDTQFKTFKTGYTLYGATRVALDKITAENGLQWSVQNNTLQITNKAGVTNRKVFLISSATGMIGSPKRIKESSSDKQDPKQRAKAKNATPVSAKQQRSGWELTTLLTPTINPSDLVKVDSMMVKGFFRVEEIAHAGGFYGDQWQSTMKLIETSEKKDDDRK